MKPGIRIEPDDRGAYTVYLLDPADRRQALHHITGVNAELSRRDEAEVTWAAERCGLAAPRDVLRDVRSALRDATRHDQRQTRHAQQTPPPAQSRARTFQRRP